MISRTFNYSLAKHTTTQCPQCHHRTFTPYVDRRGNILNPEVGRCDRLNKCAYHLPPRDYFAQRGIRAPHCPDTFILPHRNEEPSYIDESYFDASMQRSGNVLMGYLQRTLHPRFFYAIPSLFHLYGVGTTKDGECIFWQRDTDDRLRTGKIMRYGDDGHRSKSGTGNVRWMHNVVGYKDFHLVQCLFGVNLVARYPDFYVCVVESEKSALVAQAYAFMHTLPMIFVATGGCGNLRRELLAPLHGRKLMVYPDAGMTEKWTQIMQPLRKYFASVTINDVIDHEPDMPLGADIADMILANRGYPRPLFYPARYAYLRG